MILALIAGGSSRAATANGFTRTDSGPYDYNNTGNWDFGIINGQFSQNLNQGFQTITFGVNTSLTDGLLINVSTGTVSGPALNFTSDGEGRRTLTLLGDIFMNSSGSSPTATIGSTSSNAALDLVLSGNRTVSVANLNFLTFYNTVTGSGSLTKDGIGTLTLDGDAQHSGGTTVNGGVLRVGTGSSSGSIAGNIATATNSAVIFNRNDSTSYSAVISGGGSFIYDGRDAISTSPSGSLILSGQNTYGGGTKLDGGTLLLGVANALPVGTSLTMSNTSTLSVAFDQTIAQLNSQTATSTVIIAPGKTLAVSPSNTLLSGGFFNGFIANAGTLRISGDNNSAPFTLIGLIDNLTGSALIVDAGGKLQVGAAGTSGGFSGNITNNGQLSFYRLDSVSYSGVISGAGSVALGPGGPPMSPAGTLLLTGQSTYTGATILNSGTAEIGVANALPVTTVVTLTGGATLLASQNQTLAGLSGFGGLVTVTGGRTLTLNPTNSLSGPNYAGTINGAGLLVKTGTGFQTLASDNSYSGGTQVQAGTLVVTNTGTGSGTGAGSITISSGATLRLGNGGIGGSVAGNVLNNGNFTVNRSDTISAPYTYAGVVSGSGNFTKSGSGYVTLTGNNTYTGGTTIAQGYLVVGNNSTSGSILGNVIFTGNTGLGGGELQLKRADTITLSGAITGPGRLSQFGTGTVVLAGPATSTYSGDTFVFSGTFADGAANAFSPNSNLRVNTGGTVMVNFNETVGGLDDYFTGSSGSLILGTGAKLSLNLLGPQTFSGVISGAGSLAVGGTGLYTLAGANTYSGGTTISGTTLQVGSDSSLGLGGSSLTFTGANSTLVTLGSLGTSSRAITVGGTVAAIDTNNFNSTLSGAISGGGLFTKTGNGILTLLGAGNGFTGTTNVQGGTLRVGADNGMSNASLTVLAAGTTLDVQGNQSLLDLSSASGSTVVLGAGKTLTVSATTASFINGDITGGGALVKTGSNFLILAGNNTFTGGVTVLTGSLQIGGGSSGSLLSNVNLAAFSTSLTFFINNNYTYAGIISGAGNLASFGNGILTLTGTSSYTGPTTVQGGAIRIGADNAVSTLSSLSLGNSAATLLVDNNQSVPSIGGNGIVTIAAGKQFAVTGTASSSFFGTVDGAGNLVKSGTGTLTLSSNNTYSGGTTINGGLIVANNTGTGSATGTGNVTLNGGTLQIGTGGNTGAVTGNIANNSNVTFFRNDTFTTPYVYGGAISGTGSITLTGSGSVALTGNNTYTGGTTVAGAGSVLEIGFGGTAGSIAGNVSLGSGAQLEFFRSDSLTYGGSISGAGGLVQFGTGTTFLTGSHSYTGSTLVVFGTLALVADNAIAASTNVGVFSGTLDVQGNQFVRNLNGGGNVSIAAAKTLTVSATGTGTSVFSGAISGGGALTKTGSSFLVLAGNNTYTGGTTVLGGTLQIGGGSNSGSILGNVTLATSTSSLMFFRADNSTYAGAISGAGSLQKSGTGSLTLTGNSTHTGATSVTQGTLVVGSANALSAASQTFVSGGATLDIKANQTLLNLATLTTNSLVSLGTGATLSVNSTTTTFLNGPVSGAGALTKTGTSTLVLNAATTHTGGTTVAGGVLQVGSSGGTTGSLAGNATVSFGAAISFARADSTTFSGVISGTGSIIKNDAGALTLANVNLYTNNTGINGGTLIVGTDNAISSLSNLFVNGSPTLPGGVLVANNQTVAGLGGNPFGTITISSGKALTVDTTSTTNSSALAYPGAITGGGSFVKTGAGTLTLQGTNDYLGTTTVNAGMLQFGTGSGPGQGALINNAMVSFNNGGTSSVSQPITGTGGLMLGAGSTTFFGVASTYAGGTTIAPGGVAILTNTTGSALGTGTTTVTGTIGGTGTITGPLVLDAGGILSPGLSPGKLTVGPTTLGGGSVFAFEINSTTGTAGTNWDLVDINGPLNITATSASPFSVSLKSLTSTNSSGLLSNFDNTQSYSWQFVNATGGITGLATNNFAFQFFGFQNAFTGTFGITQTGNTLALTFTPVPEPATWVSLIAGIAVLGFAARRRRK